jgi:hypothetical protein
VETNFQNLKPGDLVKIWKGAKVNFGILIERTYLTCENKYNKWKVSCDGKIVEITEKHLFKISDTSDL